MKAIFKTYSESTKEYHKFRHTNGIEFKEALEDTKGFIPYVNEREQLFLKEGTDLLDGVKTYYYVDSDGNTVEYLKTDLISSFDFADYSYAVVDLMELDPQYDWSEAQLKAVVRDGNGEIASLAERILKGNYNAPDE